MRDKTTGHSSKLSPSMKRTRDDVSGDELSSSKQMGRETFAAAATVLLWELIENEIPKWLPNLHDLLSLSQTCKRLATRHLVKAVTTVLDWDKLVKFPALTAITQTPTWMEDIRMPPGTLEKFPPGWKHTLKTYKVGGKYCIGPTLAAAAFTGLETLTLTSSSRVNPDALPFLANVRHLEVISACVEPETIQELTQLTALVVSNRTSIDTACLTPLVNLQSLTWSGRFAVGALKCQQSLRMLHIFDCCAEGDLDLSNFTTLTDLRIENCSFEDKTRRQLFLPSSLEKLFLSFTVLMNDLDALHTTPRLQKLSVINDDNWSNPDNVYNVLQSLEHLESLDIQDMWSTFPGHALEDLLLALPRLQSLYLYLSDLKYESRRGKEKKAIA